MSNAGIIILGAINACLMALCKFFGIFFEKN